MPETMQVTVGTGVLFDLPRANALLAAERLVGALGESGVLVTVPSGDRCCSLVVAPETTIWAIRCAVAVLQPMDYDFLFKIDSGGLLEDRTTVKLALSLANATHILRLYPWPVSMVAWSDGAQESR